MLHLDDDKEELDAEIASRDDVVTISSMRDEIYESNRKAAGIRILFIYLLMYSKKNTDSSRCT